MSDTDGAPMFYDDGRWMLPAHLRPDPATLSGERYDYHVFDRYGNPQVPPAMVTAEGYTRAEGYSRAEGEVPPATVKWQRGDELAAHREAPE